MLRASSALLLRVKGRREVSALDNHFSCCEHIAVNCYVLIYNLCSPCSNKEVLVSVKW